MAGIILLENVDVALPTRGLYAPAPRIVVEIVGILHAGKRSQKFAVAAIEDAHPCWTPRCHEPMMIRLIQSHGKVGLNLLSALAKNNQASDATVLIETTTLR